MQVSESSVKRWCDKGVIPTRYTAGGHRRIPLSGLLEFLRVSKHELVDAEILGLPATTGRSERMLDRSAEQLAHALLQGDEPQCRQIVLNLYLAEHSVSAICDDVVAKAFRVIGHSWACGDAEVYQERRGCEMTLRMLHELRALVAPPPVDAPLAIGATPAGDHYALATASVELVLQDAKWNASHWGTISRWTRCMPPLAVISHGCSGSVVPTSIRKTIFSISTLVCMTNSARTLRSWWADKR